MGNELSIALIALAGTLGLVGFIFTFVGKMVKRQQEVVKIKIQKEILELEIKNKMGK